MIPSQKMPNFGLFGVHGLTDADAASRLIQNGPNELPSEKPRNFFEIAFGTIKDPIFLLLIASGLLYLFLGEFSESLMLLGFVVFIMTISLYQEAKTERALAALKNLSSPRALVIRDSAQKRIAGREVVLGDILVLAEGDRVPADAKILSAINLSVDESLLTGESVPVRKKIWTAESKELRPGGDEIPFVYSGTLIVQGRAVAEVIATGLQTELGRIGKALQEVTTEETRLQKETAELVRVLAMIGLSLCAFVVAAYGLLRGDWLQGLLAGIALAMAILPNEFPVVLTVFLALGAWRISRNHVLTRRIPAVENLGAATVLCTDKTGTLTLNQMTVQRIFAENQFYDFKEHAKEELPETFHLLMEFGILASQRDPFDPIEKAINVIGTEYLHGTEHIHDNWTLVREYPLSPELLALSHVWESPDGVDFVIGAKGAPEAIFDLCHFDPDRLEKEMAHVHTLAASGMRVLGVAKALFKKPALPKEQHDFDFEFLGLIGFADPIRADVPSAIAECLSAGVRVIMMTGDYPETACHIAAQIGLPSPEKRITGAELQKMSDAELLNRIRETSVFARVVPEQKLRIVKALQANGEVVAMTGDGVNDAPSLKAADIGIAMGKRGTDVARESAHLVLVEDDFSSIVAAIKTGRRVFDNLRKAMAYLLAIHIPIAGMSLIPVLFKWPLILMPVHIAFLHLIIDPACSVVFEMEPEERDVMRRKPRSVKERLFSGPMLLVSVLRGAGVLMLTIAVFAVALMRGQGEADARALTFMTLMVANIGLILSSRSRFSGLWRTKNPALWWVVLGTLLALTLIFYYPFTRHLFRFSELHRMDLLLCLAAGIASVFWLEAIKVVLALRRRGFTPK